MWTLSSNDLSITVGQSIHLDVELSCEVERLSTESVLVANNMIRCPLNGRVTNEMPQRIDKIERMTRGVWNKPRIKNLEGGLVVTPNANGA